MPPFSRLSRTGTVAVTLSAALTFGFGLTACATDASAQTTNTAETPAALSKTLPGKIVYTQLTTPDLAKAKAFYGALLGWNFQDRPVSRGHYAEALVNCHLLAGLVDRPLPHTDNPPKPLWLPFISALYVPTVPRSSLQYGADIW